MKQHQLKREISRILDRHKVKLLEWVNQPPDTIRAKVTQQFDQVNLEIQKLLVQPVEPD